MRYTTHMMGRRMCYQWSENIVNDLQSSCIYGRKAGFEYLRYVLTKHLHIILPEK